MDLASQTLGWGKGSPIFSFSCLLPLQVVAVGKKQEIHKCDGVTFGENTEGSIRNHRVFEVIIFATLAYHHVLTFSLSATTNSCCLGGLGNVWMVDLSTTTYMDPI